MRPGRLVGASQRAMTQRAMTESRPPPGLLQAGRVNGARPGEPAEPVPDRLAQLSGFAQDLLTAVDQQRLAAFAQERLAGLVKQRLGGLAGPPSMGQEPPPGPVIAPPDAGVQPPSGREIPPPADGVRLETQARIGPGGGAPGDEFGFDPDFNASVLMPIARLLYRDWFRVTMRGLENVPGTGAALVVANHAGVLPFDMIMVQAGLFYDHPSHRNLRLLGADLIYELPLLAGLARKSGHTIASRSEAARLLCAGELVGVCPEGYKGTGKPFCERYKLRRFGRGGFARTAIRAGAPIIPCTIVGAEEIYPMIGNARWLAKSLGLPYFPVTPLFPWFGLLGMIPLPSNWIIEFGPPIPTEGYGAAAADDEVAVAELAAQVRDGIQLRVGELLAERGPAFG